MFRMCALLDADKEPKMTNFGLDWINRLVDTVSDIVQIAFLASSPMRVASAAEDSQAPS
jgi:hypothetical protein